MNDMPTALISIVSRGWFAEPPVGDALDRDVQGRGEDAIVMSERRARGRR